MQWAIRKLYQHGLEDIPETDFEAWGEGCHEGFLSQFMKGQI